MTELKMTIMTKRLKSNLSWRPNALIKLPTGSSGLDEASAGRLLVKPATRHGFL